MEASSLLGIHAFLEPGLKIHMYHWVGEGRTEPQPDVQHALLNIFSTHQNNLRRWTQEEVGYWSEYQQQL